MESIKEFKEASDAAVTSFMTNGTNKSSLYSILGESLISEAYNTAKQDLTRSAQKFSESIYDEGKIDPEVITDFSFSFAINRDIAARYMCRKSLFKTANDKKFLRTYFLSSKNQSEE